MLESKPLPICKGEDLPGDLKQILVGQEKKVNVWTTNYHRLITT